MISKNGYKGPVEPFSSEKYEQQPKDITLQIKFASKKRFSESQAYKPAYEPEKFYPFLGIRPRVLNNEKLNLSAI